MSWSNLRWAVLLALAGLACACGDDAVPVADDATPLADPAVPVPVEAAQDGARSAVPPWAKVSAEQIEEAARHGVPVAFENDLGMRFVLIPAGAFWMGTPWHEPGRANETRRSVRLTAPYYVQITEVTNGQFRRWRQGHHTPANHALVLSGEDQPVRVYFDEAAGFAEWLSEHDPEHDYRLPWEAEWERACRAGTSTEYYWGESLDDAHRYENYDGLQDKGHRNDRGDRLPDRDGHEATAPVASYLPNPWGLYDMLGNVAEWCGDYYDDVPWAFGGPEPVEEDPTGPPSARSRVVRSSFCMTVPLAWCAYRDGYIVRDNRSLAGFRLVSPLTAPE